MKELLKTVIKDGQVQFPRRDVKPRELAVPLNSGKVISLIGPRRCGKSYYLFNLINRLVARGEQERILYINFEDERLDLTTSDLQFIPEAYFELYPQHFGQELYLFFDEIQEVPGWEKFIRRIYDTVSKNVFLTGSSAKLLGEEIATALRGRSLTYTLQPLSFAEFCQFRGIDTRERYATPARLALKTAFDRFLQFGGYPEIVSANADLARKTLQSYYDVMLFRDIVERNQVAKVHVLKHFLKRVLNNATGKLSIHKLYNELKSQGISVSKGTLYEFLDYSVDCFLLFLLFPYDPSVVRQSALQKKVYATDTGLLNAVSFRFSEDRGKLLENMVYLHLFRQEREVYFLNDRFECDFVIQNDAKIEQAIQVCASLTDEETRRRELRGLVRAMDRFDLQEGVVITLDEEETIDVNSKTVFVQPAWKWFLA